MDPINQPCFCFIGIFVMKLSIGEIIGLVISRTLLTIKEIIIDFLDNFYSK